MHCMKRLFKSFLDLLYPPLCLHCNETLDHEDPLFCKECQSLLTPIDPIERCPYCFSPEFNLTMKCCLRCIENPLLIDRIAAVFDYEGPAATLVKQLKYSGKTYLASGAGAYLASQYIALELPLPDVIVPMPIARLKKIERGFNQSKLLADAFAAIIHRPVMEVVMRRSGDFSQAGLDVDQRRQLDSSSFVLKPQTKLYGKTVVLIDDVMTTGTTLKCCSEALQAAFPESIYALTFCRAI